MTPREILDHLDRRFKLLTAGRRTAATRHQTLQSTLDWSHDLLDETEKVVFHRLSVFAGDFDRSMAELVVADDELDSFEVADALFKLVEKSLLVAQAGSELTRYRLLETIRDYAWERLSDAGENRGTVSSPRSALPGAGRETRTAAVRRPRDGSPSPHRAGDRQPSDGAALGRRRR
jgi:predicted ATPase